MKVGVVVFPGSNCDRDMYHVLSDVFHFDTQYFWHDKGLPKNIDAVILPGGFSYGDRLRAGVIAAHSPIIKDVQKMAEKGIPVLGVCNGFQILVESGLLPGVLPLHRYNEGTLSRMRSEYVIPLQGKMKARIEQLGGDIDAATSTAQSKRLEKERGKLLKQEIELIEFDEKLRHEANKRISLDLDDGVKVNYGKFGELLAEVKAVHGKKPENS